MLTGNICPVKMKRTMITSVATGSSRNFHHQSRNSNCSNERRATASPQLEWSIPSLPLRVLTLNPAALPDHIQRRLSRRPIAFRPTDTSCFRETPTGLAHSSKVLPLSLPELHLPSARSELHQLSCQRKRLHEHGSRERSPSTTANGVSCRFRESRSQLRTVAES